MCKAKKKLSPCFRREKKHVVRLISESLRHKNGFSITTWRRLELTNVRCILVENIVSLEFLKTESHWKIYCKTFNACTVVESHRKDLIQHCEWSKLRLHFECTKVYKKCKKNRRLASFWSLRSKSVTRQVEIATFLVIFKQYESFFMAPIWLLLLIARQLRGAGRQAPAPLK